MVQKEQKSLEEALETTDDYLGWLALKEGNLERAETFMRASVKLAEEDSDQILPKSRAEKLCLE